MLETAKRLAYGVLKSKRGNDYAVVRIAKDLALFVNELAGSPLVPPEERQTEAAPQETAAVATEAAPPRAAPVFVYVDQKSRRDLDRITGVLRGREVAFQVMDVEQDAATKAWALRTAGVEDLPAVFIAGEPVGGFDALVQLDVSGELVRKVFGAS